MTLTVPDSLAGLPIIVSISGGKDSTAMALALREAGIDVHSYVFADTGWEATETIEHVEYLSGVFAPLVTVRPARDMRSSIAHRAGFPSRMQRWCTSELKLRPISDYLATVAEVEDSELVSAVGVRHQESARRAAMPEVERDERADRWTWRPIVSWSVEDVLNIHRRHGVRVNPLYEYGFDRVGCYPCIFARKNEIALLATRSPERISEIRALEHECSEVRQRRNADRPGRYAFPDAATFFQSRMQLPDGSWDPMGIDDMVEWATSDGAGLGRRQLRMFQPEPDGGCYRWGLCDVRGGDR